jgi:hypothetical protein
MRINKKKISRSALNDNLEINVKTIMNTGRQNKAVQGATQPRNETYF